MKVLDAIEAVLKAEGKPLHYTDLTRRILERGLWHTEGKTPEATVNAHLSGHINQHGAASPFQRTGPGIFALRAWNLPEAPSKTKKEQPPRGTRAASPVDVPSSDSSREL